MISKYKQPDLSECSRDYLVGLIAELEELKADGKAINEDVLRQARAALPNATLYFVLHKRG